MTKYKNASKSNVTLNIGYIKTVRPGDVVELTTEQAKPFVTQGRLVPVQDASFDTGKNEGEVTITTENKKK